MTSLCQVEWIEGNPISLGGLLIFLQEAQMIQAFHCAEKIGFHFPKSYSNSKTFINSILSHFGEVYYEIQDNPCWPQQEDKDFPHESFHRIKKLISMTHKKPLLSWPKSLEETSKEFVKKQSKRVYALHLKHYGSKSSEESNANFLAWEQFFRAHQDISFLLLGKDPIPTSILSLNNVSALEQIGLTLVEQLALIPHCHCFSGMASGICQAAIFSNVPYQIFKHPHHHPQEMDRELDSPTGFDFANSNQRLVRALDSFENLEKMHQMFLCPSSN